MVTGRKRRGSWWRVLLMLSLGVIAVTLLLTLPFRWLPPPTSAFILQAAYTGLGGAPRCRAVIRRWVDWRGIAPVMPLAVIASEDQRFSSHRGVDFSAIVTALEERQSNGRVRGASTITQQLAKNLYLWPGQSWFRKALEAWLAVALEMTWPKKRILEVYLNLAQFDACVFGVQAASERFFNKPAARLIRQEAARLAASLPNPNVYRVDRRSDYMTDRTGWILQQMELLGGTDHLSGL